MSTETESLSTPLMQPSRGKWLPIALLFVLSFLILLFASLQYYWPGKWWESHETLNWKGGALSLVKGQGSIVQDRLTIDGLAEPGVALASLSSLAFRAEDYPVVRWTISGARPGAKVEFIWSTVESPNRVFARQLEWVGNEATPLFMGEDVNWRGQIMGLALMVRAPLDAPLIIESVQLDPPQGIVGREWFGAEAWRGVSINFVSGSEVRQWLAPLPFVAAVLGLALLGYGLLAWRKILAPDVRAVWLLVFLAWFALDARWQIDLWHKLGLTQHRYAGKSWEEKHLAAEDGRLFDLIQQMKTKLPSTPGRIFLFSDDEYLGGRGAYHLYPFNVRNGRDLLPAGQFRSGDFIVILGKDEVGFDPAQHLLTWAPKQQLAADLLLLAANNVLLKVR